MFTTFAVKFLAWFMSLLLTLGTTFGFFVKPTTKSAENYFDGNIKNVIYLIGDGMGFNHLEKTKAENQVSLAMDTFDIKGSSRTRSFSNAVTDSAAGGTALAVGVRTTNGVIGAYPLDIYSKYSYPKSITELCMEMGKLTGVLTTDATSGATPASFSAHSSDRDNTEDISDDQLASGINLIWGAANGYVTEAAATESGYEFLADYNDMMALEEGSYSFAQFSGDLWEPESTTEGTPTLEEMAVKAVDLLDDTDEGFFLMIEGAHIDKHSHNNDGEKMKRSLISFDNTIEAMLEYAKADGETLVIVTADHETGAIKLKNGEYKYNSGSHSAANVPVLVYGTDKLIESGETLNNYEIPIRIAYILGADEATFPVAVSTTAVVLRKKSK
ncbi:MAG: alkaline phosphatase [Clostridia bacterium]|nr:alkaline phosphatase [Clostridia bacterium]